MDINKLQGFTPGKMAEIIMQDDEYIFTTWGKKSAEGLAEMIRQAPDPDLLTLAKMGLELLAAVEMVHENQYHGSMFQYDTGKYCCALGDAIGKARALRERENGGE